MGLNAFFYPVRDINYGMVIHDRFCKPGYFRVTFTD